MSDKSPAQVERLETEELPAGAVIHYSGLEGGVSFACGCYRILGDRWSQYQDHVTCQACKDWIKREGEPK